MSFDLIHNEFGERLRLVRLAMANGNGLITQSKMAEYMGVTLRGYRLIETGQSMPKINRITNLLLNLAVAYPGRRVNANWLLLDIGVPFVEAHNQTSATPQHQPEKAPRGTIVLQEGKIINASSGIEKLTGYTANELLTKRSMDYVAFDSKHQIELSVDDQKEQPYEAVLIHKDGTRIPVTVQAKNTWWGDSHIRILNVKVAPDQVQTDGVRVYA